MTQPEKVCKTFDNPQDCKVYAKENCCPQDCPYLITKKLPIGVLQGQDGKLWDFREHCAKLYKEHFFDKKSRRRFTRLVTGLQIGQNKRMPMRFLTLTTARGIKQDICKDFDVLKKRIWRTFGWKFNKYFKLKTKEGPEGQVLHIVFWGRFIPQKWLSNAWATIHRSPVVYIEALRSGRKGSAIAYYLITNYFQQQPTLRMSCGWKWAWLGVCKSWKNVVKTYGAMRNSTISAWWTYQGHTHIFGNKFKFVHAMSRWKNLMQEPLPTTRQTKWCNCDHSRWNRRIMGTQ